MRRHDAITILRSHQSELLKLGVVTLYLFGSVARDEAKPGSDVDVLLELDHTPTLFELARLTAMLERWLGVKVDAGLRDSVRPPLREHIYKEAVRAA